MLTRLQDFVSYPFWVDCHWTKYLQSKGSGIEDYPVLCIRLEIWLTAPLPCIFPAVEVRCKFLRRCGCVCHFIAKPLKPFAIYNEHLLHRPAFLWRHIVFHWLTSPLFPYSISFITMLLGAPVLWLFWSGGGRFPMNFINVISILWSFNTVVAHH